MAQNNGNKIGHTSTTVIGILTVIATLVAGIPSLLSLNKEHPEIFYSISSSEITIPSELNGEEVKKILTMNGIPLNTLNVTLINQGNGPSNEILVSIRVPGTVVTVWSLPSEKDSPIWVELPRLDTLQNQDPIVLPIKNMAITKPLAFHIGYNSLGQNVLAQVEVFYDGKPGELVTDIANVSPWSPWNVFQIPLVILLGGLVVVIVWAFGVVIYNNPEIREILINTLVAVGKEVVTSLGPRFF